MEAKTIISLILGIILLNSSLYTIIPLPGIITIIAIIGATIVLFMYGAKSGILGKTSQIFAIIIGIYALVAILSFVGISLSFIPFIFIAQKLVFIIGGILLIINPFINI